MALEVGTWYRPDRRGQDPTFAVWALLQDVMTQFGPGAVVELEGEHDPNISPPMLLRRVEAVNGEPWAHLDYADNDVHGDNEADAYIACRFVAAVRVVPRPHDGGDASGVREPRAPRPQEGEGQAVEPLPEP